MEGLYVEVLFLVYNILGMLYGLLILCTTDGAKIKNNNFYTAIPTRTKLTVFTLLTGPILACIIGLVALCFKVSKRDWHTKWFTTDTRRKTDVKQQT